MNKETKNKIVTTLKLTFILLVFIIVAYTLYKELSTINFKETLIRFSKIDRISLITLFMSGASALILLSLYDVVLTRALKLKIPLLKTFHVSYIINAFNAIIGFGGFIGAGARYYVYKDYAEDKKQLIHVISLVLLSMLTGLSLLSIFVVFHIFDVSHIFTPYPWIKWLVYVVALFLPIFVIFTIVKPVTANNRLVGVYCTIISGLEWVAAASVLYMALNIVGLDVPFTTFMGIFILAAISGLISFIPGGLGAFDLVLLLSLKTLDLSEEKILLALLLYRFAYYFFPVLIALILSVFKFPRAAKKYMTDLKFLVPAKDLTAFLMSFPKDALVKIPALAMSLLLLFTALVSFLNNVNIIYEGLSDKNAVVYYIMFAIHTAGGLLLLINVVGVFKLSKRAILFSMISLVLLFVSTAASYTSYISLFWVTAMFILLLWFNKTSKVLKRAFRWSNLVVTLLVGFIMLYLNHLLISTTVEAFNLYQIESQLEVNTSIIPYYFWLTIFVVTLIVVLIVWRFERKYSLRPSGEDLDVCKSIVQQHGGSYLSHLMHSGDKHFYIDRDEEAVIIYKYKHNAYIVLGDPIGNADYFEQLLTDFYHYAHYLGRDIIFYQVSTRYMSLYHNFGNQFFKLGEEAIIDLSEFSIAGKKKRGLRATLNKLNELGYQFEMLTSPVTHATMQQLKAVSDDWLDGRKEMHFSVGAFDPDYLNEADIAVIKDKEGEIIAFCNVMPTHFEGTISVDLIRWRTDIDVPLMDGLYLHMLLWSQEQGYRYFNLGMATLSNVVQVPFSFIGERIAGRIFEHFNGLYRFQGLRRYKEKYKPIWQSRFLVYRKHTSLIESMFKVMRVIRK